MHSKPRHTFHYLYWKIDVPTPCLTLYFNALLKKQLQVTLKFQLWLPKSDFIFESTHQKEHIIEKFQLSSKMSHFVFSSTHYDIFVTYNQFCRSHFVIYSKLQYTFHYLYWNFDSPTQYLALYSPAHWTKQTYVLLELELGL